MCQLERRTAHFDAGLSFYKLAMKPNDGVDLVNSFYRLLRSIDKTGRFLDQTPCERHAARDVHSMQRKAEADMAFRISVDTGGTFTDVVIADAGGIRAIGKALTTPNRIFDGMRAAIEVAAQEIGLSGKALLSKSDIARPTRSSPNRPPRLRF
jgi:Hydantoinase/oxoprolinase N-terminal region